MPAQYVLRHDAISFMMPGSPLPTMVRADHHAFNAIVNAVKGEDMKTVAELIDPLASFCMKQGGRLQIVDGSLFFDNVEVHTSLSAKILEMIKRKEDPSKFIRFMENLLQNPEERAIMELYGFIEVNNLPITSDGHLLAYKSVRNDFYDHHSRSVLYTPGSTAQMPREEVCNDPEVTCSTGIHVCSINYFVESNFGGRSTSRYVLVKVNPKDVVSVPVDYRNSKVRCCNLTVVTEFRVRSLEELARIDDAIRKNLDALTNKVNIPEDDLRELIGMQRQQDPLDAFGVAGQRVAFKHLGKTKEGRLFGAILTAQTTTFSP
jgi:hypothetical protein